MAERGMLVGEATAHVISVPSQHHCSNVVAPSQHHGSSLVPVPDPSAVACESQCAHVLPLHHIHAMKDIIPFSYMKTSTVEHTH